jgi:hypothetical protein
VIEAAIGGVGSGIGRVRLGASKSLREASERAAESVYPHFDFFVGLLSSKNHILKWNATLTLANLAAVDGEGKLDRIMDLYLAPIDGPHMIDAANAICGAAAIAVAKPHLAAAIARRILAVERAGYATPECRNVAIGHAIHALDRFFDALDDKNSVLAFVRRQAENPRPATRAKAERFLRKRRRQARAARAGRDS